MLRTLIGLLLPLTLASQDGTKRIVPVAVNDVGFFERHERVALVVGVQDYDEDTGLSKLSYSGTADVTGIAAELRVQHWRVITLANREAKAGAILDQLEELSGRVKQDGGTFLFFFSGHGGSGKDGRNYLATYGITAKRLEKEGLAIAEVEDVLSASGAQRQVLLIDACRNVPPAAGAKKANAAPAPRFAAIETSRGIEALYATAPGSYSYEGPNGYSTFTEYILKGLRGAAAGADGYVTMDDLRRYVEREVPQAEEKRRHVQRPYHRFDSTGEIVVAKVAVATVTVPVAATRRDAAEEAWLLAEDSKDPQDFDDFRAAFPESDLARTAKLRADVLWRGKAPDTSAVPLQTTKVNPVDGLTYVWVPPPNTGEYVMGCSPGDTECGANEKPLHSVQVLKGFWLGKTEVTQAAYARVTGTNPSQFEGPQLPVETVSWNEADEYCRKTGGRLPTEAEWEWAGRGGTVQAQYGELDRIGWYETNSGYRSHDTGQKEANAYGLHDMLGNVWEWTASNHDGKLKTLRGGSWLDLPRYLRVSHRASHEAGDRFFNYGFRCVGEQF